MALFQSFDDLEQDLRTVFESALNGETPDYTFWESSDGQTVELRETESFSTDTGKTLYEVIVNEYEEGGILLSTPEQVDAAITESGYALERGFTAYENRGDEVGIPVQRSEVNHEIRDYLERILKDGDIKLDRFTPQDADTDRQKGSLSMMTISKEPGVDTCVVQFYRVDQDEDGKKTDNADPDLRFALSEQNIDTIMQRVEEAFPAGSIGDEIPFEEVPTDVDYPEQPVDLPEEDEKPFEYQRGELLADFSKITDVIGFKIEPSAKNAERSGFDRVYDLSRVDQRNPVEVLKRDNALGKDHDSPSADVENTKIYVKNLPKEERVDLPANMVTHSRIDHLQYSPVRFVAMLVPDKQYPDMPKAFIGYVDYKGDVAANLTPAIPDEIHTALSRLGIVSFSDDTVSYDRLEISHIPYLNQVDASEGRDYFFEKIENERVPISFSPEQLEAMDQDVNETIVGLCDKALGALDGEQEARGKALSVCSDDTVAEYQDVVRKQDILSAYDNRDFGLLLKSSDANTNSFEKDFQTVASLYDQLLSIKNPSEDASQDEKDQIAAQRSELREQIVDAVEHLVADHPSVFVRMHDMEIESGHISSFKEDSETRSHANISVEAIENARVGDYRGIDNGKMPAAVAGLVTQRLAMPSVLTLPANYKEIVENVENRFASFIDLLNKISGSEPGDRDYIASATDKDGRTIYVTSFGYDILRGQGVSSAYHPEFDTSLSPEERAKATSADYEKDIEGQTIRRDEHASNLIGNILKDALPSQIRSEISDPVAAESARTSGNDLTNAIHRYSDLFSSETKSEGSQFAEMVVADHAKLGSREDIEKALERVLEKLATAGSVDAPEQDNVDSHGVATNDAREAKPYVDKINRKFDVEKGDWKLQDWKIQEFKNIVIKEAERNEGRTDLSEKEIEARTEAKVKDYIESYIKPQARRIEAMLEVSDTRSSSSVVARQNKFDAHLTHAITKGAYWLQNSGVVVGKDSFVSKEVLPSEIRATFLTSWNANFWSALIFERMDASYLADKYEHEGKERRSAGSVMRERISAVMQVCSTTWTDFKDAPITKDTDRVDNENPDPDPPENPDPDPSGKPDSGPDDNPEPDPTTTQNPDPSGKPDTDHDDNPEPDPTTTQDPDPSGKQDSDPSQKPEGDPSANTDPKEGQVEQNEPDGAGKIGTEQAGTASSSETATETNPSGAKPETTSDQRPDGRENLVTNDNENKNPDGEQVETIAEPVEDDENPEEQSEAAVVQEDGEGKAEDIGINEKDIGAIVSGEDPETAVVNEEAEEDNVVTSEADTGEAVSETVEENADPAVDSDDSTAVEPESPTADPEAEEYAEGVVEAQQGDEPGTEVEIPTQDNPEIRAGKDADNAKVDAAASDMGQAPTKNENDEEAIETPDTRENFVYVNDSDTAQITDVSDEAASEMSYGLDDADLLESYYSIEEMPHDVSADDVVQAFSSCLHGDGDWAKAAELLAVYADEHDEDGGAIISEQMPEIVEDLGVDSEELPAVFDFISEMVGAVYTDPVEISGALEGISESLFPDDPEAKEQASEQMMDTMDVLKYEPYQPDWGVDETGLFETAWVDAETLPDELLDSGDMTALEDSPDNLSEVSAAVQDAVVVPFTDAMETADMRASEIEATSVPGVSGEDLDRGAFAYALETAQPEYDSYMVEPEEYQPTGLEDQYEDSDKIISMQDYLRDNGFADAQQDKIEQGPNLDDLPVARDESWLVPRVAV